MLSIQTPACRSQLAWPLVSSTLARVATTTPLLGDFGRHPTSYWPGVLRLALGRLQPALTIRIHRSHSPWDFRLQCWPSLWSCLGFLLYSFARDYWLLVLRSHLPSLKGRLDLFHKLSSTSQVLADRSCWFYCLKSVLTQGLVLALKELFYFFFTYQQIEIRCFWCSYNYCPYLVWCL